MLNLLKELIKNKEFLEESLESKLDVLKRVNIICYKSKNTNVDNSKNYDIIENGWRTCGEAVIYFKYIIEYLNLPFNIKQILLFNLPLQGKDRKSVV